MKLKSDSLGFTVLLAAMAGLPPLSTDIYLSALSKMSHSLGTAESAAGYTLSIFLAGFSLSQLFFGPMSDRLGRRPVGIFGCVLFTCSAFGCALSHSMAVLLFWRVWQGIGAGAVTVLAFAVVRDLFSGNDARQRLAYVNAAMAFVPMVAPVLGSLLLRLAGWRSIFVLMAVLGLLLALGFGFGLEESLPPAQRVTYSPAGLARNYLRILSTRSVFGYCLLTSFTFGSMLAYVTGSSFVFIDTMGMSGTRYGMMLFFTAGAIVAGSTLSGLLSKRDISYNSVLSFSLWLNIAAPCALFLLGLTHWFTVATALPLIMLTTLAVGLITPNAAHGALAPMGEIAGTAAAMLGSVRMLGGSVASAGVSFLRFAPPTSMTSVMLLFGVLAMASYSFMAKKDQVPSEVSGAIVARATAGKR